MGLCSAIAAWRHEAFEPHGPMDCHGVKNGILKKLDEKVSRPVVELFGIALAAFLKNPPLM